MKTTGKQKIKSQGSNGLKAWKGSWWRITATCLSLALGGSAAASVDEDWKDALDTDRPDLANSAHAVGAERFQLESGLNRASDGTDWTLSLPLLLRVGLGDRWEARVTTDGPQWSDLSGAEAWTGFQVLGLGTKWNFLNQEGKTLEALGFIGGIILRDEGTGLTLSEADLTLAADFNFPGETGLGVNLGLAQEDPSGLNQSQWNGAASFEFPLSRRWSGYLEGSGILPAAGDGTMGVDGGVKCLLSPDVQLDGSVGRFWTGATAQTTLALGFSLRIGQKKSEQ